MKSELKETLKEIGYETRVEFIQELAKDAALKYRSLYTKLTEIINGTKEIKPELEAVLKKSITNILKNKNFSTTDITKYEHKIISALKSASVQKESQQSDYDEVCKDLKNAESVLTITHRPLESLKGNTGDQDEQLRDLTIDYIIKILTEARSAPERYILYNLPENCGELWLDLHRLLLERVRKEGDEAKVLIEKIKDAIVYLMWRVKKNMSPVNKWTTESEIATKLKFEFGRINDENLVAALLMLANENKNILVYHHSSGIFTIPVVLFNRNIEGRMTGYYKIKRTENGTVVFQKIDHITQWAKLIIPRLRAAKSTENNGVSMKAFEFLNGLLGKYSYIYHEMRLCNPEEIKGNTGAQTNQGHSFRDRKESDFLPDQHSNEAYEKGNVGGSGMLKDRAVTINSDFLDEPVLPNGA